jgi:peptidoglycan/LPS O-acetylase OafA/YrhL
MIVGHAKITLWEKDCPTLAGLSGDLPNFDLNRGMPEFVYNIQNATMKRLSSPGFFRFLLALAVFVHHLSRIAIGHAAVYLFFCLSGYWIFRMYSERYSRTSRPYRVYLVSRLWRLLPVFLLCSLLAYLCSPGGPACLCSGDRKVHLIVSQFLILGYASLPHPPLGPAWSLDIEMQFYVLAPLLIAMMIRGLVRPVTILAAAMLISGASVALDAKSWVASYLFFFVIGMAAAKSGWKPSSRLASLCLGIVSTMFILMSASPLRGVLLVGAHPTPLAKYNEAASVLMAIMLCPLAIYTTAQKGPPGDGMFADLSYIVYLLHWIGVQWILAETKIMGHRLEWTIAGVIVVLIASFLIWSLYDRPINRMRANWVKAQIRAARESPDEQRPMVA